MILTTDNLDGISELLLNYKIGVLPTDTIYGIHCMASAPEGSSLQTSNALVTSPSETISKLLKRIYEIKERPLSMPVITLVSNIDQLERFGVILGDNEYVHIKNFWPGPNTLIFNTISGESRSFRLPRNDFLLELINTTGPLVSTSANKHGVLTGNSIYEVMGVFEDSIDFYVDGGVLDNPPSSVYKCLGEIVEKIR